MKLNIPEGTNVGKVLPGSKYEKLTSSAVERGTRHGIGDSLFCD